VGMTNFDQRARDWDADPMKVERACVVAEAIRMALPLRPGMTALEVGCGTGLLSFALQADFASITLADTSQGMLDVLAEKIKATSATNMHPIRLNLAADPLPVQHFDVLYSLMTLHHVPNTDYILQQFQAMLEPGGWLALADLDKEDGSFHDPEITDVHTGFERELLQAQTERMGFERVKFATAFTIQKAGLVYPVFLMTARKWA
jgi:ubiquinone/menaquinone biosynthesis C-methylase UbiE